MPTKEITTGGYDANEITKPKQKRTPKQYEAIEKGALALSLGERVRLKKILQSSIQEELKTLQESFDQASELVNGDKE